MLGSPVAMADSLPLKGSAAFSAVEFNGELLLEELASIRGARVPQERLNDCALAVAPVASLPVAPAAERLRQLASGRFGREASLARMLNDGASKLRTDADAGIFVSHVKRLALVGGLLGAMRTGNGRLAASGEGA